MDAARQRRSGALTSAKLIGIVSLVAWFGVPYWGRMLLFIGAAHEHDETCISHSRIVRTRPI